MGANNNDNIAPEMSTEVFARLGFYRKIEIKCGQSMSAFGWMCPCRPTVPHCQADQLLRCSLAVICWDRTTGRHRAPSPLSPVQTPTTLS